MGEGWGGVVVQGEEEGRGGVGKMTKCSEYKSLLASPMAGLGLRGGRGVLGSGTGGARGK